MIRAYETKLKIIEALRAQPGLSSVQIAAVINIKPSTINHSLGWMFGERYLAREKKKGHNLLYYRLGNRDFPMEKPALVQPLSATAREEKIWLRDNPAPNMRVYSCDDFGHPAHDCQGSKIRYMAGNSPTFYD